MEYTGAGVDLTASYFFAKPQHTELVGLDFHDAICHHSYFIYKALGVARIIL
jgi:hypothetical protein